MPNFLSSQFCQLAPTKKASEFPNWHGCSRRTHLHTFTHSYTLCHPHCLLHIKNSFQAKLCASPVGDHSAKILCHRATDGDRLSAKFYCHLSAKILFHSGEILYIMRTYKFGKNILCKIFKEQWLVKNLSTNFISQTHKLCHLIILYPKFITPNAIVPVF